MINDKAIEYNSKVIKIERLIENLKSIGINTEKYDNELQIIKEDLLEEHSKSTSNKYFGIENDYISAMSRLNKLEAHLNEYMVYFKVNSFVNYITNKVDDLTGKELDSHIDKVINLLKELKQSNTLIYDKEKEIVEKLYKMTYLLLLSEVKNGNNKLLNYVTKNEVDLYYLDKILLSEIESINNKNDLRKIKDKISLINSDGVEVHYVTKEILTDIVYAKYGENLREKISEELNKIAKEIKENNAMIEKTTSNIDREMYKIDIIKSSIKRFKKALGKQISSMGLNIVLLTITLGLIPFSLIKRHFPKTYKYTYDLDGNVVEEIYKGYSDKINGYYSGKVIVKEPYTNNESGKYYYIYKEHAFNENEFDTVLKALKDGKELDYIEYNDEQTSLEMANVGAKTTTTIEVTKQNKDDYINNFEYDKRGSIVISVFAAMFFSCSTYLPLVTLTENSLIGKKIPELKNLIEDFIRSEKLKELKEEKLDVALMNAELMKLIQNDNVLREEFMRIYKANESLFNENKEVFEELLNEIDGNGKTLTLDSVEISGEIT